MPEKTNITAGLCPDYLTVVFARDGRCSHDCLYGRNPNDCGGDPLQCAFPDRWSPEEIAAMTNPGDLPARPARLVTPEDFKSPLADDSGAIPAWKESRSPTRRSGWAVIVYGRWYQDRGQARYWTARPTDEQREGAAWD